MCGGWFRFHGLVLLITLPAVAAAEPYVSPRVAMVARGQLSAAHLAAAGSVGLAVVTVRIPGGAARLRQLGFPASELAGDVAALTATAAELRRLIEVPEVIRIEERRLLYPHLDVSTPATGAPAARAETGLDGTGVVVGLVDTGIDFRHPDFRTADGKTRLAALLDLSAPPRHPELGDFRGAIWLRDEIDATLAAEAAGQTPADPVTERDRVGHGTCVAGVIAGNGRATGRGLPAGRYVGMAPGAAIIGVQASRNGGESFTNTDVLLGVGFIFERAAALGLPAVVNLSLGAQDGPHAGNSNQEVALEKLAPPDTSGRAVVVSAGNEGEWDNHAGAWNLSGSHLVRFQVPTSDVSNGTVLVEVWYRGILGVRVESPAHKRYGQVDPGGGTDSGQTDEGRVIIDNTSPPNPQRVREAVIILVGPPGKSPAGGIWLLTFAGRAARYDAWVAEAPGRTHPHFLDYVAEDDRLGTPATADTVITVGSVVTRDRWPNVMGSITISRSSVVGQPSLFSSSGPTADGRFKPDLSAPGEWILSSLSADAGITRPGSVFFNNPLLVGDDGVHAALQGTSLSAPHVSGAVALLLQADPTLTPRAIREILRVSARSDGPGFSNRVGFGRLDVLAALHLLQSRRGGAPDPQQSSVAVSRDAVPPGDETTLVSVIPRDAAGVPLGPGRAVDISASAGLAVSAVIDFGQGRYERTFAAHASRGKIAKVTATVDGVTLDAHPSIYFVSERSEIGRPFVALGGCSVGGRPVAEVGLSLLLGLLGCALLRRRL